MRGDIILVDAVTLDKVHQRKGVVGVNSALS